MKILLTSVGRRGYLVKYFKRALGKDGRVWGADSSPYTPAFEYCDKTILIPEIGECDYAAEVLTLCKKNKIDIVVPLIDPELIVLAKNRQQFYDENILVVVSPVRTIEIAYDKFLTYQFGKDNGIAVPQTFINIDDALQAVSDGRLNFPLLVKPRNGSASLGILSCQNESQLRFAFENCPQPMIQQYIKSDEYGIDSFCDFDFAPISVLCKKKLLMRAGETDKAVSVNDPALLDFGLKIVQKLQVFGPADLDVVIDNGEPKLLEINPRFGGGYPCAHLAGADFPGKLIAIRNGNKLNPDIGSFPAGIYMLKQDEIITMTE